jgi:5'-nucleotidase
MNILVSNDDGADAPGIRALYEALADLGRVIVVAPCENHSGASSALSLHRRVRVLQTAPDFFRVEGTPTDCAHLALTGDFLDVRPDILVSGVNNGENMGDDTIYSGTVAAAMEGFLFRLPSIAVSLAGGGDRHFSTGAKVARALAQKIPRDGPRLLNVNVPDIPFADLRGYAATRLGRRHIAERAKRVDGGGDAELHFEIGDAGSAMDGGVGTDFHAVAAGYVSVTPLGADLTDFRELPAISGWLP